MNISSIPLIALKTQLNKRYGRPPFPLSPSKCFRSIFLFKQSIIVRSLFLGYFLALGQSRMLPVPIITRLGSKKNLIDPHLPLFSLVLKMVADALRARHVFLFFCDRELWEFALLWGIGYRYSLLLLSLLWTRAFSPYAKNGLQ